MMLVRHLPFAVQDINEIFGWIQTLLVKLGVWDMLGFVIQTMLVVTISLFLIRMFRSS
jgi:hypothetical protein